MPKPVLPSLIVMFASVTIASSQDLADDSSVLNAAVQYARFADDVALKLELSGAIVQAWGPSYIQPIGRQRLDGEVFRLRVAGPKLAPLALDARVLWTVCSKYNLGLPFEYMSAAPSESWAVRK